MDLTFTKRGNYVVRAAIALAGAWDGDGSFRKLKDIAQEMRLPPSYTPQLLGLLAKAGLAEAKAGRTGGYRLTRDPRRISVLEVVEAAEGSLAAQRCAVRGGPCRWDEACALHPAMDRATRAVRASLARTTLAEVAEIDRGLGAGRSAGARPASRRAR